MNNPPKEIWINEGDDSGDIRGGTWSTKNYLFSAGPYTLKPKPLLKWIKNEYGGLEAEYNGQLFEIDSSGAYWLLQVSSVGTERLSFKKQSTAKAVAEVIAREL